ncbi:MAG: efflux RND transporter periplasmic adaptor subunit [Bacteroidales bacterium]|jgi:cobalt-zinc-cadmium efflux system membrane fusion protein|nr:efflux RND transporter periplasmic adaptor subunit [Bacteroidales bacterium]
MINKKIILLIAGIAASCAVSCSKGINKENDGLNGEIHTDFLKEVKTTQAVLSNRQEGLTLTGKVEYDPDKIIHYSPLISGVVEKTYFSLGDKVKKGDILFDIRSTELTQLLSEQTSLKAEKKIVERELKSAQSMFDSGMLSERELLEVEARLNQCRASLQKTETDMFLYGYNELNGTFSVKAPMTGFIVDKNISSGSTISSGGEIVFTIADLSTVWISANVYAGNLQFVHEGMEVDITTLSYPGEIFKGKIKTLSQVFDPEEKVLKARIPISNSDLKFKPEMSVLVTLQKQDNQQFLTVSSNALIFDDNRYFLVVADKNNESYKMKEVVLQGSHNGVSYIASGIQEGDNIVIGNQLLIYEELKKGRS